MENGQLWKKCRVTVGIEAYPIRKNQESPKRKLRMSLLLREVGIDEVFVARKLKDLSGAQGRRWNPKKGSWEKFEDHGTQLAALREIAKILGLYPSREEKDSENANKLIKVDISALPMRREAVLPTTNRQQEGNG